ncbi:MAG: peptidase [Candidatus Krumholzibacteria bacterium]
MKTLRHNLLTTTTLALAFPLLLSCGGSDSSPASGDAMSALPKPIAHKNLKERIEKYAQVTVSYDESILSEPEKRALSRLVEAAGVMDEIFLRQVWSGNVAMRENLARAMEEAHNKPSSEAAKNQKLLEDLEYFFNINFGPWDRLDEDSPYMGDMAKPKGANYYPEDLTKEEFEAYWEDHPEEEESFRGFFTTIRRKDGELTAVPYSSEYRDLLQQAAALLHETADILTNPENRSKIAADRDYTTLAKFLRSRADAFSSNDYVQSDMDWMDVVDNVIDVTIGPYEVYEDGLNSYKAAFEAFIAIRNPEDSRKLEGIKRHLQTLENSLPIPDEHKNPNRGSESPIAVVDLVYAGGDTKAGVQTLAYNLPNDETVREIKGSKKVMLKNISHAKFDKILVPIARELLDSRQAGELEFDAYFTNVLMHEMAHGLGPGKLLREDGTETTVSRELKELYPPLEEAKADVVGLYCKKVLMKEGFFEKGTDVKGYIAFLPGFFRAIRFGASSAHGKANMIEFNFMREQGAITFDKKNNRFHVNIDKMPDAVETLSNRLLMIQALGDYEAAKAFHDKYGQMGPDVERMLKKLENIPVDIKPNYMAERHVKTS